MPIASPGPHLPASSGVLILLLLVALCGRPVAACTPQQALAYRSPEVAAAQARLTAAQAYQRALGWRTQSTVAGQQTAGHDRYTLSLALAPRPTEETAAARQVAEAERTVRQLTRDGIRQALLAHATLWTEQAAAAAAQARYARAEMAKREIQRKAGLGAVASLEVQEASLLLEDAALGTAQAARALAAAKQQAGRYGLDDSAVASVATFALPDPAPETLWAAQQAAWDLRLADARALETRRAARAGLGVQVSYFSPHWQALSSFSSRTPSADLVIGYPSLSDASLLQYQGDFLNRIDKWEVTVQAEFPLSPSTWAAAHLAKAEVAAAHAHLTAVRQDLAVQLPLARQEAQAARERLEVLTARLALKSRLLEVVRAREAAGSASALEVLDTQAVQADTAADLARAWKGYLDATARYLELADGAWVVEGQQ